jgi:hypothetical protein
MVIDTCLKTDPNKPIQSVFLTGVISIYGVLFYGFDPFSGDAEKPFFY